MVGIRYIFYPVRSEAVHMDRSDLTAGCPAKCAICLLCIFYSTELYCMNVCCTARLAVVRYGMVRVVWGAVLTYVLDQMVVQYVARWLGARHKTTVQYFVGREGTVQYGTARYIQHNSTSRPRTGSSCRRQRWWKTF